MKYLDGHGIFVYGELLHITFLKETKALGGLL